ncbi:MAG TPA: ribonuclease R [Casimicrobiaceae bacterium]|nr:ribonuclease R [Casimicrobiaceae bacterium]
MSKTRKTPDAPAKGAIDAAALLARLTDIGVPIDAAELAAQMDIGRRQRAAFDAALDALMRRGDVIANRKGALCVAQKIDVVAGTVTGHPDGYGFLVPDAGGEDFYLAPREMHKVLHGDRVAVRETGVDRRGRREGEIVEVLERRTREVVGRLHEERGVWFVVAENRRISQDLLVPDNERGTARPRDVVVAEIIEQPGPEREAVARVKEVLGGITDPGMEIEIALRKHALPFVFAADAEREAKRLPAEVRAADRKGREDLTHLPIVTIDGETARDFDDAVYCERKGSGFRLVVAIADVSHYVKDGSALDRDARERGNSVYFPRRVIPMLPEALSNELCSLKPEVDRLCMACEMTIDAGGAIIAHRFFAAVIHSRARLTYDEVWSWLDSPAPPADPRAKALLPHLRNLYALYKVLVQAREARGAIDFDTVELALVFDARGKIERIVPAPRNDAHKLIEECMLAANVCAADFLAANKQPVLYRVHAGPTPEKLVQLKAFLASAALELGGGDAPTAMDYARLMRKIEGRPDQALLQTVMLRSLQQAQYRPDNVGHFGLAYDAYAHFTSPIRRYPDLLVHRAIKAVLAGTRYVPPGATWNELGVHCSLTERRADDATRDVEAWLKCFFMRDRIGEVFAGTVSGVTSFGLFVTLDELNVDGLVHITELGRDYFRYEAARHELKGERSGAAWRLGGRITVRVARVDLDTSKIDFVLADAESPSAPRANVAAGARAPSAATSKGRPSVSQPLSREDLPPRTRTAAPPKRGRP